MKKWTKEIYDRVLELYNDHTWDEIAVALKEEFNFKKSGNAVKKAFQRYYKKPEILEKNEPPRVLFFDIETTPLEVYTWSLWQDSIPLNMVKKDWSVLSFAAKWMGEDELFYEDVRNQKDHRDDKKVLKKIWKLLDEADIVVGHNSDAFDVKKLNARFALNGMQPPSGYKRLDTKKLAKKHFSFTSNKLEYLTDKLCVNYKKLKHSNFPGFSMWKECLKNNITAYDEMKEYNLFDVLSLEELFKKMLPWESANLFQIYGNTMENTCTCGHKEFKKSGFEYTATAKYQKYKCKKCGSEYRDRENLISKEDRKKLKGRSKR